MANRILDPFECLGLPRDATGHAIKAQYHALARRYHPNRHQGSDETKATLAEHFHNVHEAWKLLSKADNRRRRVELLNLLDLQDDMLARFVDLLNVETPEEHHQPDRHEHSDLEGHISSDADEDLPNVGLQRRQTFANRNSHVAHLGDHPDAASPTSPTSPTKKHVKILSNLAKRVNSKAEQNKGADYFTLRRKKLEKLRRKELEAFMDYRDAMVTKFEAEEEAERQQEHYERAKWKREYFERAPRGTSERFRSFQQFMGAVTAFGDHAAPRQRNRSDGSYGLMSPAVGPGEMGSQFLFPDNAIGRQKTLHRRGWSSDISGDQSDSDDSGEANGLRKLSPPGRWYHHSSRSRDTAADAFRGFTRTSSSDSIDSFKPPPAPFKLVVRQPTDLGTIQEAQDSSGDTPSGSSRSPSPQPPVTGMELTKFTWMPSPGPSAAFGIPTDHRARSPSPSGGHRRHASFPESDHETSNHVAEGCSFITKQVGAPHHLHVPYEHVYELNLKERSWMLGTPPDAPDDPSVLLDRLHRLDPMVAAKFMVKPDIKELFRFRLIYSHRHIATKQHQSFIALSYRRKLHVEKHSHHFTLPLEPEIFQAVWEERLSDNEGLWIDQICIDQDSREETTISMSAMDMVYRSARLVVVALDDIELDAHEGELLQNHMDEYNTMTHVVPGQRFRRKNPPWLESHDDLYKIIRKVLRSSWFKRAWCRHEMRLAKHHIFLISTLR